MDRILDILKNHSLEEMFYTENMEEFQWIWFNEETIKDIFINLSLYDEMEEEINKYIGEKNFKEIEEFFTALFKKKGFEIMEQNLFASLEEGYKTTTDIDTVIYLNDKYYKKLHIKCMKEYGWILMAMAIDTYKNLASHYENKENVYEEMYEDNSRILEEVLSVGEYNHMIGTWKIDRECGLLRFYKGKKFYNSWSKEEVEAIFRNK
ncbi:MAG: hypothetical protein N4A57_15530 [Anaeromicrobium sp.]|jgi:hypothetical protein|uniref:hypothetical protein n=1 Tax=Anaeromicrobium sp. TaxID=1929132 RepID=UPI0025F63E64|nr:hypothetical protein [Anaeromicrobium sp.]MCT4595659.1 hypothetical protein [Anaeromicrobium sp.]